MIVIVTLCMCWTVESAWRFQCFATNVHRHPRTYVECHTGTGTVEYWPWKTYHNATGIGLCDTSFKLRYRNHTSSFRNERYRNATELSKHVWNLKDKNIQYNIKWRKIKQARSYSNVTKKCNLCLWEKYFILCKPEMSSLNNRNELVSCCRHSRKFLLRNVIT